jgi:ubiquinol-cytochrome c reductase cytochrome b subunit
MLIHQSIQKIKGHSFNYPTPININYHWSFGSIVFILLLCQLISGLFLASHYIPNAIFAFDSIEKIMRNLNFGWFLRYFHANGVTVLFFALYYHIGRAMYYGLYEFKRNTLMWYTGIVLYLLMMATAFLGYVLPWGQMSFWGATVITNLLSAIPLIGDFLVNVLWGALSVNSATLNRFFILHFILPFIILILAILHLIILHDKGSSNKLLLDNKNLIPFSHYCIWEDMVMLSIVLLLTIIFLSNFPNELLHGENYIYANELVTPPHLAVEWYFAPFYTILRAIPSKVGGILMLLLSIAWIAFLPLISKNKLCYY